MTGHVELHQVYATPPSSLRLSASLYRTIVGHLRASLPREGCGLLAVHRTSGDAAVAARFYPGTNLDASPTRYTMDPAEVLAAFQDLDANGWTLGAIVHSHPATPPSPSPTDLREAYYPEALMTIVSFATVPPVMRCWSLWAASPPLVAAEVPIVLAEEA
jgi:proteasome lid subunit RPN8/RPN11